LPFAISISYLLSPISIVGWRLFNHTRHTKTPSAVSIDWNRTPMNPKDQKSRTPSSAGIDSRWLWLLGTACLAIALLAISLPRPKTAPAANQSAQPATADKTGNTSHQEERVREIVRRKASESSPSASAKEIVAAKLNQFANNRLELACRMAAKAKVEVTPEIARFFEAAAAGNWQEVTNLFHLLRQQRDIAGSGDSPMWRASTSLTSPPQEGETTESAQSVKALWSPILETFGVAEEAHDWPAQKLLDYGNAVLGSLKPGMVYVGGTDPGRFIPTFLNETSDGEHHIVLTQNAFADNTYLQYVAFQYGDQLQTLSKDDSDRAFQEYLSDAQKRLQHDQQFPNEPRQVRPGEDIQFNDGKMQVSGQIAVMAINEKLMQSLMAKNPDTSFAMEQSFPFTSTYAGATTLGPIMELRVNDPQNTLTADRASQAVDYWRIAAQQLLSDPEATDSSNVRQAWSKMADDQAALLLDRKFPAQAEAAFQVANDLCPWSPESVFRYVNFLLSENRIDDALRVATTGAQADPKNQQMRDLAEQLKRMPRK
jgi:hypothetical protein